MTASLRCGFSISTPSEQARCCARTCFTPARRLRADHPPAQAVDWLRASLAEVFGRPVPEPVATVVTSWATDPFTRGAYTQCPPGADPSMFDALGEPAHGRLLLAGEHTSSARSGYADGAYASGLRAGQLLTSGGNSTE